MCAVLHRLLSWDAVMWPIIMVPIFALKLKVSVTSAWRLVMSVTGLWGLVMSVTGQWGLVISLTGLWGLLMSLWSVRACDVTGLWGLVMSLSPPPQWKCRGNCNTRGICHKSAKGTVTLTPWWGPINIACTRLWQPIPASLSTCCFALMQAALRPSPIPNYLQVKW